MSDEGRACDSLRDLTSVPQTMPHSLEEGDEGRHTYSSFPIMEENRESLSQSHGNLRLLRPEGSEPNFGLTHGEVSQIRHRYQPGHAHDERRRNPVEDKHQQLNTLFGIRPWKASVTDRPLEEHSHTYQELYADPKHQSVVQVTGKGEEEKTWHVSNIAWVVLCGWWLGLLYGLVALLLSATWVGRHYGRMSAQLGLYFVFPFGKYLIMERGGDGGQGEHQALLHSTSLNDSAVPAQLVSQRVWTPGYVLWCLLASPLLTLGHVLSFVVCWFLIFFVPMAKVMRVAITEVLFAPDPLNVRILQGYPAAHQEVILCVFRAANRFYYKYSAFGINIVLLNMLPFVLMALVLAYLPLLIPALAVPPTLMFVICMASVIPLAYYIGLALSSLSAQTSFAVGAVLNATFGSLIEFILYASAIMSDSGLGNLVQSSVTGTLLGMMLLLPGLAMLAGGLKYKEVRFNPVSAGVSGVLLLLSVVGAFTPTVYYAIYGNTSLECTGCTMTEDNYSCSQCSWSEGDINNDPVYNHSARPLMYVCAGILPISYVVGLLFTLKTHAYIVDDPEYIDMDAAAAHGPSGPRWSKLRCLVILVTCTILFALISEEMVDTLSPTLESLGISQTFAGLTIIALIPNTAEFVNAIQFAMHNNFSMSLEIANSAAVQVALLQMPALVFFSALVAPNDAANSFTLIFPSLDLFAIIFAVIIMNYISIDGRANYFTGVSLVITYALFAASFYYVPS